MEKLARELYIRNDDGLDLDEVLEFIHNADSLTTSTFYKDLANIPNHAEIMRLPDGIRSARVANGKKRLFVLFRQGSRQMQAGLFDASGRFVKDGDRRDLVMQAIRCDLNEPKAPARVYPEDDDSMIGSSAVAPIGSKFRKFLRKNCRSVNLSSSRLFLLDLGLKTINLTFIQ
jgi:hypothetical protein